MGARHDTARLAPAAERGPTASGPHRTVWVRYYALGKGEVVGRHVGIAAVFGQWPARVLRHRGWTAARLVFRRRATAEEADWLAQCRRLQAIHYESARSLLSDEAEFVDETTLASLARAVGGD